MKVMTGFVVVKTFERMCREYLVNFERCWQVNHPSANPVLPEQMPGKYRGIDRDPIQPWVEALRGTGVVEPTEQELAASLYMEELTRAGKADDDFIFAVDDARKLLRMILPPVEREMIWARRIDGPDAQPPGVVVLDYEPTAFYASEHESAIATNAFFRYWRSDDKEDPKKKQFRAYHSRLNRWGLFDTPAEAEQYLSFSLELVADKRTEGMDYIVEGIDYIAQIGTVE
ncbi:MAG: hypothetical protein ACYSWO_13200 [Planctomycetota bacterium]|jgi:hypothetical protein